MKNELVLLLLPGVFIIRLEFVWENGVEVGEYWMRFGFEDGRYAGKEDNELV